MIESPLAHDLLQMGIAFAVATTTIFSYLNNRLARKTSSTIGDVKAIVNGNTSRLQESLALEQQKNAQLQALLADRRLGDPPP